MMSQIFAGNTRIRIDCSDEVGIENGEHFDRLEVRFLCIGERTLLLKRLQPLAILRTIFYERLDHLARGRIRAE